MGLVPSHPGRKNIFSKSTPRGWGTRDHAPFAKILQKQSLQPQAAIDGQDLTGDKARSRSKEEYSLGHILRRTVALHGGSGCKTGSLVLTASIQLNPPR